MTSFITAFIERWLGTFPRVVVTFTGVFLCALVIVALWDRRLRISSAILIGAVGFLLVFHPLILRFFAFIQGEGRLRLLAFGLGIALIGMTVEALRRANMRIRYGVLWIGCGSGLIGAAMYPSIIKSLVAAFGISPLGLLGGGAVFFLFVFSFHLSLAVSHLYLDLANLRKRIVRLESTKDGQAEEVEKEQAVSGGLVQGLTDLAVLSWVNWLSWCSKRAPRTIRGTKIGGPAVIFFSFLAVLVVGLAAPQAMIGDEVTHYYMLVRQAQDMSQPNFFADIPLASGVVETRRYPHSFGWHYLGALVLLLGGGSSAAVQLYQACFLAQLLSVAYLLARSRGGVETRSALLYVLTLASLPLSLLFSVAFYQDVPMTAQILTAFFLLKQRRWFWASGFIILAVYFKVTAVLFFPVFLFLAFVWERKNGGWHQGAMVLLCTAFLVLGNTWLLGKAINKYAESAFYPQEKLEVAVSAVKSRLRSLIVSLKGTQGNQSVEKMSVVPQVTHQENIAQPKPMIVANHPGDLRIPENYFIFGGLLLWLVIGLGAISTVLSIGKSGIPTFRQEDRWLFGTGCWYLLLSAYFVSTAPDARFFLPAIPFILLPIAERVVHLPKPKWLLTFITALALLQGGYVLNKAYTLRGVSPGIKEGIEYLSRHPIEPKTIFMYPEGNYRLFPVSHEWYLGYQLREFWMANNDKRISMLHQFGIGAVVVKKQLISPVDDKILNLGVYPPQFVEDLRNDGRFKKIFENDDLLIFQTPPYDKAD